MARTAAEYWKHKQFDFDTSRLFVSGMNLWFPVWKDSGYWLSVYDFIGNPEELNAVVCGHTEGGKLLYELKREGGSLYLVSFLDFEDYEQELNHRPFNLSACSLNIKTGDFYRGEELKPFDGKCRGILKRPEDLEEFFHFCMVSKLKPLQLAKESMFPNLTLRDALDMGVLKWPGLYGRCSWFYDELSSLSCVTDELREWLTQWGKALEFFESRFDSLYSLWSKVAKDMGRENILPPDFQILKYFFMLQRSEFRLLTLPKEHENTLFQLEKYHGFFEEMFLGEFCTAENLSVWVSLFKERYIEAFFLDYLFLLETGRISERAVVFASDILREFYTEENFILNLQKRMKSKQVVSSDQFSSLLELRFLGKLRTVRQLESALHQS
jgi:hypothetical protein